MLYGIPLRNGRGERAAYVGRTTANERPEDYLNQLRAPKNAADAKAPRKNLPGRLYGLWKAGFRYCNESLCFLRNTPASAETAAARALEDLLGPGRALGGVLALDSREPVVQDACALLRFHDRQLCCKCGAREHLAENCTVDFEQADERLLQFNTQRLQRQLKTLGRKFQEERAALEATIPLSLSSSHTLQAKPDPGANGAHNAADTTDAEAAAPSSAVAPDPLLPIAVRPTRLRSKQPRPPQLQAPPVQPAPRHVWASRSGVSHTPQTHAPRGGRPSFQVTISKAGAGKYKLYHAYSVATVPPAQPCGPERCWQKLPGQALQSCGRDVCVYAASVACHEELLAACPDKRRRVSEEDALGDLQAWKARWL